MAQGKCNLLKPVDCTTGTFFMFSQVAQDLTAEFTQPDSYRVVPSKFAALKLDLSEIVSDEPTPPAPGPIIDWDSIGFLPNTDKYKMVVNPSGRVYNEKIEGQELYVCFPTADFRGCSLPATAWRTVGAQVFFDLSVFVDQVTEFTFNEAGNEYVFFVYFADGAEPQPEPIDPSEQDNLTGKTLGQVFQNYFENACTHIRSVQGDGWNPEASLPILWNTLEKYGLISLNHTTTTNSYTSDNLKYIGDINIYSYNPTSDGIGYSEIYCYIPEDAKSIEYPMHYVPNPISYNLDPSDVNIHGYEGDETATYTGLHWMLDDPNVGIKYYDLPKSYGTKGCIPDTINYLDENIQDEDRTIQNVRTENGEPVESFDFNAILVMYDVVGKANDTEDDRIIYHNIPLGIYFTGKPEGTGLTNTITKFVRNEDIYNQGTAYGLRVCSRFLCSPNLTKFESVETSSGDYNAILTEALSKMAENVDYFQDVAKEINVLSRELTTHLANFRNNKVNVPYLRNLNGTYYWFVNGRNTGVPANSISREEVDEIMRQMDRLENTLEDTIRETMDQMSIDLMPMDNSMIIAAEQRFRNILGS